MGRGWINTSKTANAQKKGAIFTKLAREIQVAARMGGPDPQMNSRLRLAIEAARKQSCTNETIDRAVKKGSGQLEGQQIEEITFEGYGPHGVGVLVEVLTDNRNRTVPEIRLLFKSHDGNMGESGSVQWMFERVSMVEGIKSGTFDPEEEAILATANEVFPAEEGFVFYGAPENLENLKTDLQKQGWKIQKAELSYLPKNPAEINEAQKKDVVEFLAEIDDHDDVQKVFATLD